MQRLQILLDSGEYCKADCTDLELATELLGRLKQVEPSVESDAFRNYYLGTTLVKCGLEPIDQREIDSLAGLVTYLVDYAMDRFVPEGHYMGFKDGDWHKPFGVWKENAK